MTASSGFTGKGTVLSIGVAGSPETFVPILEMKTAQFSGQSLKFDDITNFNSPQVGGGVLEEVIPSSYSPGSFTTSGIFLPADPGYGDVVTAFNAGTLTDFKIQLPKGPSQTSSGDLYAFSGYISDNPLPDVQFDKTVTVKISVRITTLVTRTAGS